MPAETDPALGTGHTVLLVDDERAVLDGLELALHATPFDVISATSAAAALELLKEHDVSVVVSDECMPNMTGTAFLSKLRREHPAIERIMLTGTASVDVATASINQAHVLGLLHKPCPPDALISAITEALHERRNKHALGPTSDGDRRDFQAALNAAFLVYQPIVDTNNHRLVAVEALLRSSHVDLCGAESILAAGAELARLTSVDRRVHGIVADEWSVAGLDTAVFVNTTPESLGEGSLLDPANPLHAMAHNVVLEITEGAALRVDAADTVARLRRLGYRIAIDDLGSGHSSLNRLTDLQPDVVKFDVGMIREIDQSSIKTDLVGSLTESCRRSGILTVAEGIETLEELEAIRAIGCDFVQGYRISRPEQGLGRLHDFDIDSRLIRDEIT